VNEHEKKDSYETVFLTDIETKVFQAIVFQTLQEINSIELIEGSIFDTLLGGEEGERMRGIHIECDETKPTVNVKIELNILYGVCIPEKSVEIELKVKEKITQLTGFHIGLIHVTFKNIVFPKSLQELIEKASEKPAGGLEKDLKSS
jgi:uncharacterized alkaline shock family protein YloU